MTSPVLVCPADEALLARLTGHTVVLVVFDEQTASDAIQIAKRHGTRVSAVRIRHDGELTALTLPRECASTPVVLYVSRMGEIGPALGMTTQLRKRRGRVMLSTDDPQVYVHTRILASLGVSCGLWFGREAPDWERLIDLGTYALLGQVPHGPIEPFDTLARKYQAHQMTDWSEVYYDDPTKYLHVDREGRVALTSSELEAERFLAEAVEQLSDIDAHPGFVAWQNRWKAHFLQPDGCGWCSGWRVCLGRHAQVAGPECTEFYSELISVVEKHKAREVDPP